MTTTPVRTHPATRTSAAPVVVALAALGPLAVAILRGILPTFTDDDAATVATTVAAHPGAQNAVLWLTWLALLTLPLGLVIVGRLAVRARPVLGAIAATVAWLGFVSLFLSVADDQVALAGATTGTPTAAVATMIDGVQNLPAVAVATTVFVACHILGSVLLGVALWRAVPRWAAVALAVSQPLHLVFAVIVPNHALDAAAWLLTTIGFAVAAYRSAA